MSETQVTEDFELALGESDELDDTDGAEEPSISIALFDTYEIEAKSEIARGKAASMLDKEVRKRLTEGTRNYLEAGYFLHIMKDSGTYRSLGDHIKTWSDYLSDRGISIATDNNLRGIATIFGKHLSRNPELLDADYKRLTEVLSLFRTKPEALEAYKQNVLARPDDERKVIIDVDAVLQEDNVLDPDVAEEVIEDRLKEQILYDAVLLPKKGWESQLKLVKGATPPDECLHDGEYDILYRCRACGQLYSPEEGHSEHYNELIEKTDDELVALYLDAIEKQHGEQARNHTHAGWHKRKNKFVVCEFTKSESGIYGQNMTGKEYDRKGFVNLIIDNS